MKYFLKKDLPRSKAGTEVHRQDRAKNGDFMVTSTCTEGTILTQIPQSEYAEWIEERSEIWIPKISEEYYFVDSQFSVQETVWLDWLSDRVIYEKGNCFQTREEAEILASMLSTLARNRKLSKQ